MRRMPTAQDFEELEQKLEALKELCIHMVHVENIQEIGDEKLEALRAGDIVIKHTEGMEHAYRVTYKEEHVGICISYYDASCIETVSYDYVEGHWVYNSTDITVIGEDSGE